MAAVTSSMPRLGSAGVVGQNGSVALQGTAPYSSTALPALPGAAPNGTKATYGYQRELSQSDGDSYTETEETEEDEEDCDDGPLAVELTTEGGMRVAGGKRRGNSLQAGFSGDEDSDEDSYSYTDEEDDEAMETELVDGGARRGVGDYGSSDDEYYDDEEGTMTTDDSMEVSGNFSPMDINVVRAGGQRFAKNGTRATLSADMELDTESEADEEEEEQNAILIDNIVRRLRDNGEVDLREFRDIDWDDATFSNEITLLKLLEGLTAQKAELMNANSRDMAEIADVETKIKETVMSLPPVKHRLQRQKAAARKGSLAIAALPEEVAEEIKEDDAEQNIGDAVIVQSRSTVREKNRHGRRKREPKQQRAEVNFGALPDEPTDTEIKEDQADQQVADVKPSKPARVSRGKRGAGAAAAGAAGAGATAPEDGKKKRRVAKPKRSMRELSISQLPEEVGGEITEKVDVVLNQTNSLLEDELMSTLRTRNATRMNAARRNSTMEAPGEGNRPASRARRHSRRGSTMSVVVPDTIATAIPDTLVEPVKRPAKPPVVPKPPSVPPPSILEKKKRVRKGNDHRKARGLSYGALPDEVAGEINEDGDTDLANANTDPHHDGAARGSRRGSVVGRHQPNARIKRSSFIEPDAKKEL